MASPSRNRGFLVDVQLEDLERARPLFGDVLSSASARCLRRAFRVETNVVSDMAKGR